MTRRWAEEDVIRRERRLPIEGELLVEEGDLVGPEDVVARGVVENPDIREVRLSSILGIDPSRVERHLLRGVGETVEEGEPLASYKPFLRKTPKVAYAPISGTIEAFSPHTGRMLVRGHPLQLEVRAHIPGRVVEVYPREGATIETRAAWLLGAFGLGGEARGGLSLAVQSPEEPLEPENLGREHRGKVVVGGSYAPLETLRAAAEVGVASLVVGGVDEEDLVELLGYELGVISTGTEDLGYTLVVTEGFGPQPMDGDAFHLLQSHEGGLACVDSSTQIRWRIKRPEVILPLDQPQTTLPGETT